MRRPLYICGWNNNGKLVARKRQVQTGNVWVETYWSQVVWKDSDVIITEGYQNAYDGQAIITR